MLKPYDLKQDPSFFESACKIMIMIADEIKIDKINRKRLELNVQQLCYRLFSPFIVDLGSVDIITFEFSPSIFQKAKGVINLRVDDFVVTFEKVEL